jgi:hypothetical protein
MEILKHNSLSFLKIGNLQVSKFKMKMEKDFSFGAVFLNLGWNCLKIWKHKNYKK